MVIGLINVRLKSLFACDDPIRAFLNDLVGFPLCMPLCTLLEVISRTMFSDVIFLNKWEFSSLTLTKKFLLARIAQSVMPESCLTTDWGSLDINVI